jgi:hypothetical protein
MAGCVIYSLERHLRTCFYSLMSHSTGSRRPLGWLDRLFTFIYQKIYMYDRILIVKHKLLYVIGQGRHGKTVFPLNTAEMSIFGAIFQLVPTS